MSKKVVALGLVGLATAVVAPAALAERGDVLVRAGATMVAPKSDNMSIAAGTGLEVGDATTLGFNVTYMLTDHVGVELLGALPFTHDVDLCVKDAGCTAIADTKQLPPTMSVQYHFTPSAKVRPYVGVGANATLFFDTNFTKAGKAELELTDEQLKLDTSIGFEVEAGVDVAIDGQWFVNADVRYVDIESDAQVGGGDIGSVKIDPMVYSLMVGRKF